MTGTQSQLTYWGSTAATSPPRRSYPQGLRSTSSLCQTTPTRGRGSRSAMKSSKLVSFHLRCSFFNIYIYKENKDPLILNSLYSVVESWADVVSTFVLLCGVCMLYLSQAAPVSSSSPKTWWHGLVLMESLQVHPIPQCIGATWGSVF